MTDIRAALAELVDKASDYVKPRRTTDARQLLLAALDAARAALVRDIALAEQPAQPLTAGDERRHVVCVCPDCVKPAQPLTDEQIDEIWNEHIVGWHTYPPILNFRIACRAVERAHGIGGKP